MGKLGLTLLIVGVLLLGVGAAPAMAVTFFAECDSMHAETEDPRIFADEVMVCARSGERPTITVTPDLPLERPQRPV